MGTYVGCSTSESYQNVPNVFVTEMKYDSREMEILNILYMVNLVLLLMPVLAMAINKPLFKRLDEGF